MWETLTKFGLWVIRFSPRTVVVIFIAAILLIFCPPAYLRYLSLDSFKVLHPHIIGLTFLVSGLLVVTYIWDKASYITRLVLARHKSREALNDLTLPERKVLQEFLGMRTKTKPLLLENGVVRGLEVKGIIFRASGIGHMERQLGPCFDYTIHDWAWKKLNTNPKLIEIPEDWIDPNDNL